MTIYRLEYNSVADDPEICVSSYRAPRTLKRVEYYSNWPNAKKRQQEMYDSISKLLGFIPKVEITITEIEVIE